MKPINLKSVIPSTALRMHSVHTLFPFNFTDCDSLWAEWSGV